MKPVVDRRGFLALFAAACAVPLLESPVGKILAPAGRFFLKGGEWHSIEVAIPWRAGEEAKLVVGGPSTWAVGEQAAWGGGKTILANFFDDEKQVVAMYVDKIWAFTSPESKAHRNEMFFGWTMNAERDIVECRYVPGGIVMTDDRGRDTPSILLQAKSGEGFGPAYSVIVDGRREVSIS